MDTGTILALIISGCSLLFVLAGGAIAYGVIKRKVEESGERNDKQDATIKELATRVELQSLEIRLKEDREHNAKQHEELFASRNEHSTLMATIAANMKGLTDAIADLKTDLKEGLKEVRDDIRNKTAIQGKEQ